MQHTAPSFRLLTSCLVTLAATQPCAAQVRVEVTPFVGAYLPNATVLTVPPSPGGCLAGSTLPQHAATARVTGSLLGGLQCGGAHVHQRSAPIVGGQITGWLGSRLAVDLSLGYSWSGVVSEPCCSTFLPLGVGGDTSAHVVIGSAQFLFVAPFTVRSSLYLIVGGAFVAHRGDGYAIIGNAPTEWGVAFGVGVRTALTPTLTPRADLLYKPAGEIDHLRGGEGVLSLGLAVALGGRMGAPR